MTGVLTDRDRLASWLVGVIMRAVTEGHRNGQRVPVGAVDVARLLANTRHNPPRMDVPASTVDAAVMPPVAVDYATAAAVLGVSCRTVSRRVAAGQLPVTGSGRGRRILVAALVAYAEEDV